MRVTLLYFAAARERAATHRETVELPDGATAGQALARASELHPALSAIAHHLRLAVDKEFAPASAPLRDGAEVALVTKRLATTHWKRKLPTVAMISSSAIGESYLRPVDY